MVTGHRGPSEELDHQKLKVPEVPELKPSTCVEVHQRPLIPKGGEPERTGSGSKPLKEKLTLPEPPGEKLFLFL